MATAEFKVFHAVGAVIAHVKSNAQFLVLTTINRHLVDFSATSRLLEVDLMATPLTVGMPGAIITFSDVKFDDRGVDKSGNPVPDLLNAMAVNLGITTLGAPVSGNLKKGAHVGAVYIEHKLFDQIKSEKIDVVGQPSWPKGLFELHEITSIAYSNNAINDSRQGKRYHGFQARVVNVGGTDVTGRPTIGVEFHHKGSPSPPQGPFIFTLNDPEQYDHDPPPDAFDGLPPITANPTIGAEGPMFVALPLAAKLNISGPKLPVGDG